VISKITEQLKAGPKFPHELLATLPETSQDPQNIIRFMIEEGKMVMNNEGKLGMP
jgi:hypothetical protein